MQVNLEFRQGTAQRVAVHSQLARGAALVALVFIEHCKNEALLKLAHGLGIKNIAAMHLQDERLKLVFQRYTFLSLARRMSIMCNESCSVFHYRYIVLYLRLCS